jgi:chromate transport protein ChrA
MGWHSGGAVFHLPAFLILLALSVIYSIYGNLPAMRLAFYGLGPVGSLTLMLGGAGATMFARMILALPCGAFASFSSADLDAANQN